MPNENKRFYWLKLKKDFFKRHDIRIIEAMPNGKDIEDKMDEFLNQKESFYATANERLSYFKSTMTKLLNNESVEDEQDSLPF